MKESPKTRSGYHFTQKKPKRKLEDLSCLFLIVLDIRKLRRTHLSRWFTFASHISCRLSVFNDYFSLFFHACSVFVSSCCSVHVHVVFHVCSIFVSLLLFFSFMYQEGTRTLSTYFETFIALLWGFFGNNFIMKFEIGIFMLISVLLCMYDIYRFLKIIFYFL